ncbi:hypothetical protein HOY34_14030 [Xinfangfangia sp. D13-10-4-6]|uniref:YjbF family lipoprotein n=1 Tax=Pseudogemmobacter hezensis TaxID=2737662 RepID=UPI00155550B1|nr:YjbF family lipoprotein [Pseudogemmobacter hezensis]NPD16314.1 hypothetical protein [Pseudogemmobacter hezensis]
MRLLLILILLTGCADLTKRGVERFAGGPDDSAPAEMAQLVAIDAPRMIVRLPQKGQAVTVLLAGERAGVKRWRGTDNAQLYTKDAMIIGTRGLGDDLIGADPGQAVQVIRSGQPGQITRIHRRLDGQDRLAIRSYVCDITPGPAEQVRISETRSVSALRIDETCHSPGGGHRNRHWLYQGQILQSEQSFSPEIGPLVLTFLP